MPARDPREAVLEHLAVRGAPREVRTPASAWTMAHLDTVEFVKQREVLGQRLFVVRFVAEHTRSGTTAMHVILRAERVGRSWIVRGGGGGGFATAPAGREPRVDLGGTWGRFGFCGGGRVHDTSEAVARVRLRFTNGIECEDDTETGWVLFYSDRPVQRPHASVELLADDGELVTASIWPPQRDLTQTLLARIPRA
jgi:hypothetical protein